MKNKKSINFDLLISNFQIQDHFSQKEYLGSTTKISEGQTNKEINEI